MHSRLIELIDRTTSEGRRFKQLEEWTGVEATKWRNFYGGKQRPTSEMIEGLCRHFPSMALWITTGQADFANRQFDPAAQQALDKHTLSSVLDKDPSKLDSVEVLRLEVELARRMMIFDEAKSGTSVTRLLQAIEMSKRGTSYDDYLREPHESHQEALRNADRTVHLRRSSEGDVVVNVPHTINMREPYSPALFEWGYHGTGPQELAANVLHWHGCTIEQAKLLASDFSRQVIADLPRERAEIHPETTEKWLKDVGQKTLEKYQRK